VGELGQDGGEALVAPDSLLTSRIAAIWSEVLGLDAVDGDADFFELGGDSLAAVRMLFALEERMSVQVSFSDFLEAATVDALASALAYRRAASARAAPDGSGTSDADAPEARAPAGSLAQDGGPDGHAPLSFAQERLWFLEQLGGSTAAYNMPIGARLSGPVDVEALGHALRDVVSRHEALRTTFAGDSGGALAVSAPTAELELEQIDLRGLGDPRLEAQRILAELASRPFDLERGPLVRAALVRLGEEERVLELVFHHMVCDGHSHSVIMGELGALYEGYRSGRPAALAEPRVQYRQFARRQRAALEAQGMDELVAPWLERLAGAPQALELPTDRPRPAAQSYAGATHRMRLPPSTTAAVRRFARAGRTTPYATLLSAFFVLLLRHSGQQDIVIGATTAARERPELQDGVGLFANTVALRGDLSGDPSFEELVGRVRETVLWAIAHERAPLQEIVARLALERDLSRHPLFQAFCAQVPLATLAIDGAEPYDANPTTSRFDLTLFIEEEPERELELAWEYSTDLFDAATIERLARRYVRLLEHALSDPRLSIDELALLDQAEEHEALAAGRAVHVEYPIACMHHLFEQRAAQAPDALAVSFGGESLSYRELNERSNRLARCLQSLDATPETLVALYFEPSIDLVVAILGVLKSGAAYVPLDPEHPSDRLAFVLRDASARLLVTHQQLMDRLPAHEGRVVCLEREEAVLAGHSPENPACEVTPESLAYVIYTSGSTGRPKGVQVEHRQIARLFSATEQWFGFDESDTWMMVHSYAFDVSVWELWGALAHGGRLVVSPFWTTRSPRALAELVAGERATVLSATPSLFTAVQEELLTLASELALRFVVFAGEALHPASLRPWFDRFGEHGASLINMYGITETTVHSTYRRMRPADCGSDISPIGVAIPDLSLHVLDPKRKPVPPGVAGELYVGGAGVTRGYLNRPELTAERFLENPFAPGRLYRSGDIARRLPDGELEFRGRIDDQVKIRGFRIELGEIEGVIREHPGVSDCAVVAIEAAPGDRRLAAYVVADGTGNDAATPAPREALLAHLRRRLPSYMVPAALTSLERIPLTRNGKIDRRALPTPSWEQDAIAGFAEPETSTERIVAEVWRSVLAVERVGAEDDFFKLGGHSLLAARVVTQVRQRCEVEISVRALFEHPTLRELSAAVDAAVGAGLVTPAPPGSVSAIRPVSASPDGEAVRPATPASFPQQQLLFFDQLAPGSVTYNAALAWRAVGPLDVNALRDALNEVLRRQEALRTVLVWSASSTPSQVVLEEWSFELPIVDISHLTGEEREAELARLLSENARRPFDLAAELMLRTTLFRLEPEEHVILFTTHHVAFDAWAVEVFYREMSELYAASLQRRDAELPRLSLQYRDFAVWQRDRLKGDLLSDELDFWRMQLAGAPTVTRLPADRSRAVEQTFDGATHRFVLDSELAGTVRELCAAQGVTPYMLLLAAFGALLYRAGGQDDILFGGPMANRQLPGIEHLIGFFANTVIVRVRLGGNPSFSELLGRVCDSVLASYEHQEVPLELVVEAVRPERDAGVHPLFQVNFRVRVGDSPGLELVGTRTQPLPIDLELARFELALELQVLEDRIEAELNYNVALFDQATVQRLACDFESVLRTLTAEPDTRLLAVQLSSEQATQDANGAPGVGATIRRFRQADGSRS
jgi:amino acid adenylation domain-containing protein